MESNNSLAATAIDAIRELQSRTVVSQDVLKILVEMYALIWCEAIYDSTSVSTREFASKLLPLIQAVNAELKFKK